MSRKYLVFIALNSCFLCSCIKSAYQNQIGKDRWEIGSTDIEKCSGETAPADCDKALRPGIQSRAAKICGDQSRAILEKCQKGQKNGLFALVCQLKCVSDPSTPRTKIETKDIYLKSAQQIDFILFSPEAKKMLAGKKVIQITSKADKVFLIKVESEKLCVRVTIEDKDKSWVIGSIKKVSCR